MSNFGVTIPSFTIPLKLFVSWRSGSTPVSHLLFILSQIVEHLIKRIILHVLLLIALNHRF